MLPFNGIMFLCATISADFADQLSSLAVVDFEVVVKMAALKALDREMEHSQRHLQALHRADRRLQA